MGFRSSCDEHRQEFVLAPVGLLQLLERALALALELAPVGIVGDDRHAAVRGALGVERRRGHEVHRSPAQRRVGNLDLELDRLAGQHAGHLPFDGRDGLLTDDLTQVLSHQLLGLLPEAGGVGLVGPDEADAAIVAGDHGGRRVDDDLEMLPGLPDLRLGALALGDVLAGAAQARRAGRRRLARRWSRTESCARPRRGGRSGTPSRSGRSAADPGAPLFAQERAIVGMDRRDEEAVVDLDAAGLIAEDPIRLVGPAQRARRPIVAQGRLPAAHVRRGLRLGEHALAVPQRPLGAPHLADVGDERHEAPHATARRRDRGRRPP